MEFEKPEDAEDWLARISVALLITAIFCVPIVGGVLWLWLDAPTWALIATSAIVFVASLTLVFSPEADENDVQADDNLRWTRVASPTTLPGWGKRIGMILLTWWGLGVVVNVVVLGLIFDASDTAKAIASIVLIPLAVLLEAFDLVEIDPDPQEKGERHSSTSDADVRQTFS